uniref:leucine--tRNA ligase n=1 Tax=Pinguiococcus pyrenoidosus TaxID=172671 RepID=A0A7R9UHB7_9STRA
MTKAEFRAHYERLKGRNVLFPFGFHCTGMPIQAAANKLRDELKTFGCPPEFPAAEAPQKPKLEDQAPKAAPEKKGKGKKSKLVAKTGTGVVRQWNILKRMVPEAEIPEFVDPLKWLQYFPPYGMVDLKAFGVASDWRRSFITTSVNPYYDSFIRWQFAKLRAGGRIKYGRRPSVFSILDGQVCADHDRASGEGATPQEYTIVKLRVPEDALASHAKLSSLSGKDVFLAPATLRPETMYGQTNCFVLPDGQYGAYEIKGGDVLVMSERAAKGMMYQELEAERVGELKCLVPDISGWDLLGLPLNPPQATYDTVYTLPLLTISMGKGTGVVTSVPSDAPDDYAALKQLQDKPDYAEKYNILPHMVDFEVVPIIEIPGYGNMAAVTMCEKLGVKSPNDREKLAAAKDEVYLKGFTDGVLLVGPYANNPVKDVKARIRADMIAAGTALAYWEPESKVMSRSGDECIVALTEQWYLSYDDEEWTKQVMDHITSDAFNAYAPTVQGEFEHRVGWLGEWACSRKFGLGTLLPWDESWVIESLSDSTIYMAYYTIAHLLQGEANLDGKKVGPSNVPPEAYTEDIWDYIFFGGDKPSSPHAEVFEELRTEFEYWYPMDLRVSAKDLIPNHLTMALFNHCEVWKSRPDLWPRGMYANGHILVDAEKMSKSKGNFIMMHEGISSFSADAVRFACADAGDTSEDANFARATANTAILMLTTELDFISTSLKEMEEGAKGDRIATMRGAHLPAWTFFDKAFENDMNVLIAIADRKCEQMLFRDALKAGFFEMRLARDRYRDWAVQTGAGMHAGLLRRWIEASVIMLSPFCPHWAEHIWRSVMGHTTTVFKADWPKAEQEDALTSQMSAFLMNSIKDFRRSTAKKSGKKGSAPAKASTSAAIFVSVEWVDWKQMVLAYMRSVYDQNGSSFPPTFNKDLKGFLMEEENGLKPQMKSAMQFGNYIKPIVEEMGPVAMAEQSPFDQEELLRQHAEYIAKQLELETVRVYLASDTSAPGPDRTKAQAEPGRPTIALV